jgi:hypothetical protein
VLPLLPLLPAAAAAKAAAAGCSCHASPVCSTARNVAAAMLSCGSLMPSNSNGSNTGAYVLHRACATAAAAAAEPSAAAPCCCRVLQPSQ